MRKVIEPGYRRKNIKIVDNVVFSRITDLDGEPRELKLTIMMPDGDKEIREVMREEHPEEDHSPKPVLLWVPGGGWRYANRKLMLAEFTGFVDAGYVVVSMAYRDSSQGKFPQQIIDVKTAVRFLRANASAYEIDPERIGIFGRSAGGHLALFAAMNLDDYETEEWEGYSSRVQACCNFCGPADLVGNMDVEETKFSDPSFRWHNIEETHGGAFLGGDPATMKERAVKASPINYINDRMCPVQMFYGDEDPVVPIQVSGERFYARAQEMGLEERVEYYVVKHGGHCGREYSQPMIKELMLEFFDRCLK